MNDLVKTFAKVLRRPRQLLALMSGLFLFATGAGDLSALESDPEELLSARKARHLMRQTTHLAGTTTPNASVDLATGLAIAQDWPVSYDDLPSRMIQKEPLCLPGNGDGGLVIFVDERNGPFGLWGVQVNASGYPISANALVYAGSGPKGLGIPAAVNLGSGLSLVVFPDVEQAGIFALPINNDPAPTAPAGRVSPMATEALFDRPDIAASSTGTIIVWEDYRFGSRIYARQADSSGLPVQAEFIVHEDLTAAERWVPRVAVGRGDTTLFVWEDYRGGIPDIYYRIYAGDGTPVTGDLLATTEGTGTAQYQPDVTYGDEHGFFLCWVDARSGSPAIYGRLINTDGSGVDNEFVLADPADSAMFWEPSLASDGTSNSVVVYESLATRSIICGQRLFHGVPFGNAFSISLTAAFRDRFNPAVTYRADGGMLAAWTDHREGDPDVRARSLTMDAAAAGDDLQLNDDGIGNQQYVGDGARSNLTSVYAVYADHGRDEGDIYVREISAGGQLFGGPVRVNDDDGPARQAEPTMDIDGDGTLYVAWTDVRAGLPASQFDIFFQALPEEIAASESNLRISDDDNFSVQTQPDIAVFPAGGAIVVWTDYRLGDAAGIFGQIIDESYGREDTNFQVGATSPIPDDTPPKTATFNADQAAVGWRSVAGGKGAIWISWLNRATGPMAPPFELPIDPPGYEPMEFDLAALPTEGFIIFWRGEDGDSSTVYYQKFDNSCVPVGANVRVSVNGLPIAGRVSVDVDDNGYMLFCWTENIGGLPGVVRRVFGPAELPLGPAEAVSSAVGNAISYGPVAVATGRYGAVLFNDNRTTGRGFDVRAGFNLYTPTGIIGEEEPETIPGQFGLLPNYPNPFNPSTIIEFNIPTAGEYELVVYDILGRKVRVLSGGFHPGGAGSVTWNGDDQSGQPVPSGIYFSRLRGQGFESTCKMTLMK